MARLSKLKEVKGWEVLDDFYGRKIRGINNEFYYLRSFCRCGDVHNITRESCDKCGNYDFIRIHSHNINYYNNSVLLIDSKYVHENTTTKSGEYILTVYEEVLLYEIDKDRTFIEFKTEKEAIIEFHKDKVVVNNPSKKHYALSYLDKYIDDYQYWNEVEKYLKLLNNKKTADKLYHLLLLKQKKVFMNDEKLFQFPHIARWLISNESVDIKNTSFFENIKNILHVSEEYFSTLDYEIKEDTIPMYYLTDNSYYGYDRFLENLNKKTYGIEGLLKHNIMNHTLCMKNAKSIYEKFISLYNEDKDDRLAQIFGYNWKYYKSTRQIYYYSSLTEEDRIDLWSFFDKSYLEFFEVYFKENIFRTRLKEFMVEDFVETIKTMIDLKMSIKEENFKLKTYNYYLNKHKFADHYKLPANKVNLFLDMFEVNPLEALELVKDRKKMTKQQLDDFIDYMSNL